jgi:DNA-binding IclR family transcriptional regulator
MSTVGMPRTQSLSRAGILLRAVGAGPTGGSASELARATGIPRSTVARTLRTLADMGFVEESEDGWTLGYGLLRLAREADPHRRLVEIAYPRLAELRDDAGESALLAVPRRPPGIEILLQLDAERHIGLANWVGADVPLHASSAGKLVLSELDASDLDGWLAAEPLTSYTERTIADPDALRVELARVGRQQWGELVDELETGLASVSVPVRSSDAKLAGVIGVSGPTFRLGRVRRRELLPRIQDAAHQIELALASG